MYADLSFRFWRVVVVSVMKRSYDGEPGLGGLTRRSTPT
jgi:hypothetical protein